jgi:hypothetical protein
MALAVVPLAGLLLVAAGVRAGESDESAGNLRGEVAVGGQSAKIEGAHVRADEYGPVREEFEPTFRFDIFGRTGSDFFEVGLDWLNELDHEANARMHTNPWVDARFEYRTFHRRMDHDRLRNVEFRELSPTGTPGGKMTTHEDTDPFGEYGYQYTDVRQHLDIQLPMPEGFEAVGALTADYRDQKRVGTKQILGVDHCSNCHVRSQRGMVDEQTRDLTLGLDGELAPVAVSYRFTARDFDNKAEAAYNRYMQARHPVSGANVDEFGSRVIYNDSTLTFAQVPDVEKMGHAVKASADLPRNQSVRGSFAFASIENQVTGLELTSNSASLAWYAPLTEKVRATASFSRREIENDPTEIDLPAWRDGRTGGGQDFDWTRESAYDREELIGTARVTYALRPGHRLRLDYRLQTIDRDNVLLDPDSDDTKTTKNRIRASWAGRLPADLNSRVEVSWENTDLPFVNVDGLCEVPVGENDPLAGNTQYFYFQREIYGTGTSLPTQSLKARANVGASFGSKLYGSAYVSFSDEKNDDLNVYDFERSSINPGVSLLWVPTTWAALNGGAAFHSVESNAKICATVMDG